MSDQAMDTAPVVDPIAPSEAELESFETESTQPNSTSTTEQKQEIQKQIEKLEREFKLKVNGKEIVEKVDLNDEQRIVKALQMEKAAQEAFQRAAAKEKELTNMNSQLDQFFKLLQENPLQVLLNPELGLNAEEIANKILDMKIEEELKSPEQKALEEAKAKLAEYESKEKEAREEAERLRNEKLQEDFEREITTSITTAIEKGDLPASPYIVAKFGQLLEAAIDRNIEIKPDDLIPLVKNAYMRDMRDMIGKLPDEIIEEMVTPDRIKGIRNKRIQAVKQTNAKVASSPKVEDTGVAPIKNDSKKKENFFKKLGDW
jgi:hypothetical protein